MSYISKEAIEKILRQQEIILIEIKAFKLELFIIKAELEDLKNGDRKR